MEKIDPKKPNTCRRAKCPDCGSVRAIAVWDMNTDKDTRKEFGKMAEAGYNIEPCSLEDARLSITAHSENCTFKPC